MREGVLLLCWLLLLQAAPAASAPESQDLLKSAEEVLAQVVTMRGLEAKWPIQKGIKNRQEIRSFLLEKVREGYPPEEVALEEKFLVKLGVIPRDLQLLDFMLELLTEQIAGFYDPRTRMLYIADWIPLEGQKPVIAHELLHALQDQHFDLASFIKKTKGNDDATAARHAVVEGDGLAIMLEYMLQPVGQSFLLIPNIIDVQRAELPTMVRQYKIFASAPAYLREWLLFPYTYGMNFVQAYRKKHSWVEMAQVYADPPRSTEQIIHPEKYLGRRDDPSPVMPGPSPSDGEGEKIYSNVLGEFGIYLLLKQFIDEASAQQGAEGWDGDLVELFEDACGSLALVLDSVWDTEEDASQFFEAYRRLVEVKYAGARLVADQPGAVTWISGKDRISLQQRGTRVEVMERESWQ